MPTIPSATVVTLAKFFTYNVSVLLNNGDGPVGILDLLTLLANWGPCA